jgi:cephalosporin hydroxylase
VEWTETPELFLTLKGGNLSGQGLTVIIPARNEKYLSKTIDSVLVNARGEIEVIAVLDGYWPTPPIKDDPRVKLIHHDSIGQRQAINEAARIAKGKYIMKLDGHCAVDEGFDVKLAADCEYEWTVVPRMYNLDIETFTPKLHKRTDYMYMGINGKNELRAQYYSGHEWRRQHAKTAEIDDTMCCMGPGWFLHKDRFWEQGGCDETHGSWGQQGIEVSCKAWLSGGALKVNKKTWFAHWFRAHEGWPYPIRQTDINKARDYSKDLWMNNKWDKQSRSFEWLINKFDPPGWRTMEKRMEVNNYMFQHLHREKHPAIWKGVPILKMPTDMFLFHKVIWETKPDFIVEIGTKYGGSALFMQDMCDMAGNGKVITIDIKDQVKEKDPRITYLIGDSICPEIVAKVKELVGDKTAMLVIDGKHTRVQVKWELHLYKELVKSGHYIVIEDCYNPPSPDLYGPGEARDWFLRNHKEFINTKLDDYYLIGFNMGGWIKRQ